VADDTIEFDKPVTIKTEEFIGFGRAYRIDNGEVFYFRSDKPIAVGEEVFLKVELPRAKVPLNCYVRISRAGFAGEGLKGYVARLTRISELDAKRFDNWLRYMSGGGTSLSAEVVVEEEAGGFDARMASATESQVNAELRRLDEQLGTTRRSKDPYGFGISSRERKAVDTSIILKALASVDAGVGRRRVVRRVLRKSGSTALQVESLDLSELMPLESEGDGVDGIDYEELLFEAEADNQLDDLLEEAVRCHQAIDAQAILDEDQESSLGEPDDPTYELGETIVVTWKERAALQRDFAGQLGKKLLRVPGSAPSRTPDVRLELPDGQVLALRSRLTSQEANHFELRLDLSLSTKGKLKRAARGEG